MRNARESFMEAVVCANGAKQSHAEGKECHPHISLCHPRISSCHPRISSCHPRVGGDPEGFRLDSRLRGNDKEVSGNDKWGSGNDNHVYIGTRLPRSLTLPRNDGALHNKNVIASGAKQFLLDSTVIARSVATKQSHAGRDKIATLFQGSAHDDRFLDSRLRGNDKWGRGNDNHVSIGTRLPREHSLPRNDGALHNKNVIASGAKQSFPHSTVIASGAKQSHAEGKECHPHVSLCHPRISSCHPRVGGDPEGFRLDSRLRGNDKWGRGNDKEVRGNDKGCWNDITPTNENGMKTC